MNISWFGGFDSVHAFPTINRKLSEAMEKRGHRIYRNRHYTETGELTPVYLVFGYEYIFNTDVRHDLTVGMMTWEFGGPNSVPLGWRAGVKNWDLTLSICEWVSRVFHKNGMKNVATVNMGVDPEEFQPVEKESDGIYRFLWAGGSDKRHGWDLAIRAFREAFPDRKDVRLILKMDTNYPGIKSFVEQINDPRIEYYHKNIASMAEFYHSGDCLVFPVRGAGPGLIGMEAMACGLPVIITGAGGPLTYSKFAYRIGVDIQRTSHHCKTDSPEPYWTEPKYNELVSCMKEVFNNQVAAKVLGKSASDYIRTEWTWDKSAERLEYLLEQGLKPIEVSMIILVHNRPKSVIERCIDRVVEFTNAVDDPGFEILIVDNNTGAWEVQVDAASKHPHNQVVRNDKDLGVSLGRNVGMKHARGKYLMFLDDDAFPTRPGWLKELLSYFRDPSVGIVGQTGTYIPEGQWGIFWEAQGVTECDVVQGYCQVFPRWMLDKLGPLDEKFGKFWHEDADWCLRIREAGYKVIDAHNVGVWHMGSCSGDDGTYVNKINHLRSKWEGKPKVRVPRDQWNIPYHYEECADAETDSGA